MGKAKSPKTNSIREIPSEKDTDAAMQDAPRKYRQLKRYMDLVERRKHTVAPVKKQKKTEQSTQESLNELRTVVNQTAKRQTKKYEKRKQFLSSRKEKQKRPEEEIKLVDHIPFGERVKEPPKISVIPKKKGYIKSASPTVTKKIIAPSREPIGEKLAVRKHKLKDLPEADRIQLLKERQRMIDYYRSKKA
jgi:hypothetical protein